MNIIEEIKKSTSGPHKELEDKLGGQLFHTNLQASQYRQILGKFHLAYVTLEGSISDFPLIQKLLQKRSKIAMLERDIENLSSNDHPELVAQLPFAPVQNLHEALGVMYVMEGATLGGKYITGHLKSHGWANDLNCTSFFNSYGDRRGEMWKAFIELVENHTKENPRYFDLFMTGVNRTFTYLNSIF